MPHAQMPGKWSARLPWSGSGRYFHLELSNRYRWYVVPAKLGLIGLCIVLGICIAGSLMQTAGQLYERQTIQTRLEHVQEQDRQLVSVAQQEGIDLSPASLHRLPAEVALANQLLTKRNFSWTQFLSGLESAIPANVAIKSVRLDPVSAMVHLTGAAVSVEDVTALALKLQQHPVFRDPVLGQHHAGGDGLVEFDLTLKYRPDGV